VDPSPAPADAIDELLRLVGTGDQEAAERLVPVVYAELKQMARTQLRRLPPGQTLQTTALVHEAWLRLSGGAPRGWESRAHYFGAAAKAMRQVLVDQARHKGRRKRGGDRSRVDPAVIDGIGLAGPRVDLLDLDAALDRLERVHPLSARVVSLKFFAGLSMPEVSEVLDVPLRSVEREWRFARAWLETSLEEKTGRAEGSVDV